MTANLKNKNNRTSLNWTQLHALTTGVSSIDLSHLTIRNRDEAHKFAVEYGFDIANPEEAVKVRQVHKEAVAFIESNFLEHHEKELIPVEVKYTGNPLDLLVYASNYHKKGDAKQLWSCAVLKVMHCIFHIDHDLKMRHFDQIREQVFKSFENSLERKEGQLFLVSTPYRLPVVHYIRKRNKGRNSIILKLLQKPANVASDIYDHLGMRMVFGTRIECLFALKILRKNHLIGPINIKPFRSRNTLVDLKRGKAVFNQFRPALDRAKAYPRDILKLIEKEMDPMEVEQYLSENPHSSKNYNAIQFTVRKMIKIPNPIFAQWQEVYDVLRHVSDVKAEQACRAMERSKPDERLQFYFDFEIQILDEESFQKSLTGPASHGAYKQRQLRTARNRVLGKALLRMIGDKIPGHWIDDSMAAALL